MAHLIINHHFFFDGGYAGAFKGPNRVQFRRQLELLCRQVRPARSFLGRETTEHTFSISIDDGSKSILGIADIIDEFGVYAFICICGSPVLSRRVLEVHKINLIRETTGDEHALERLLRFFPSHDFDALPISNGMRADQLYRYDGLVTRRFKIALNYQLTTAERSAFVSDAFGNLFTDEARMADEPYLSIDQLSSLSDRFHFAYHGFDHALWSGLTVAELTEEIAIPPQLRSLFKRELLLSIPFGMENSFDAGALKACGPGFQGAFTMLRSTSHNVDDDGYQWLHRFDQSDLFKDRTELEDAKLASILRP